MSRASLSLTLGCFLFATPGTLLAQWRSDNTIFTSGNLKITRHQERVEDEILPRLSFQRDRIMFGDCIDDAKYRRMPMTYYAPQGPLGMVLQKFNWFPGPANTYYADARLPASLVAQGFPIGLESLLSQLGVVWSEPPVAVLGMEIGTPASYARPFQQFHFFEPTKAVIDVSDGKEKRFFHYIPDARARGAAISIFHGSPRQQLAKHGPRKYYHLMILEACSGESGEKLFLELLTKEAIAECMEHLTDDGILCVHTSHRFVELPPILAAIGAELKLSVRRGHDQAPGNSYNRKDINKLDLAEIGHTSSEWVLLARNEKTLETVCRTPAGYDELLKKIGYYPSLPDLDQFWSTPKASKNVWTDKGPNLLHGVLRGHPFSMRYQAAVQPVVDFARNALPFGAGRLLDGVSTHRFPLEGWMMSNQLRDHPDVRELWP